MIQFQIVKDKVYSLGEVPYLGISKEEMMSGEYGALPNNYDGWFPFMRMCYSLGDLGIVSSLFSALKTKHPNIKIAIPTKEYVDYILGDYAKTWSYDGKTSGAVNMDIVWGNNPYIDSTFGVGSFDSVFTDHDRSYTGLINDGEQIRSVDEPLVEQILRRFGFTDEELSNLDLSPQVYFTDEEKKRNDKVIDETMGEEEYGCLLFAARSATYKKRWEHEPMLYEAAEKFRDKPVFFFSEHELKGTEWENFFPNRIDFKDLNLSLRDQIYIKRKALFNIGYQTGISDSSFGDGTEMHTLSMTNTIRENCIRGVHYYFKDRTKKIY